MIKVATTAPPSVEPRVLTRLEGLLSIASGVWLEIRADYGARGERDWSRTLLTPFDPIDIRLVPFQ